MSTDDGLQYPDDDIEDYVNPVIRRKSMEEQLSKENYEPTPLYEFYVAGVQHHELHKCIKEVKVGDHLDLVQEPTNPYDPNAVRIEFVSLDQNTNFMLGYVPKAKGDYSSKVSATMMIRPIVCKVLELNPPAKSWERLKVGIFDLDGRPGEEEQQLITDASKGVL